MPVKKKTKTKEAPAKAPPEKNKAAAGWSLFDHGKAIIDNANSVATDLKHRKKNRHGAFSSMSMVRRSMTPVPHFMEQFMLSAFGYRHRCILELIGEEALGKTTKVMQYLAQAMLYDNAPCLYSTADDKLMLPSRVERIMHRDPVIAKQMVDMITVHEPHALHEMVENMEWWVKTMRGKVPGFDKRGLDAIPMDIPLVVALEHPGKLLSKAEAAGYYDYADYMNAANAKKLKQINEGSNLDHSRFAAGFMRHMQAFQSSYNVFLIWTSHQNEKIDMSGGFSPSYIPEITKKLHNKTKNMGRAVNQNAAYQIIMAKNGVTKDANDEINGIKVKMRVEKNSYGPPGRIIEYELRNTHTTDTATYQEPVFYYHNGFCKLLADKGYMGVTVSAEKYSCKDLGLIGLSAEDFEAAFLADQEAVNRLGAILKIDGYDAIVDKIQEEMQVPQPPPEPPQPPETEDDETAESSE